MTPGLSRRAVLAAAAALPTAALGQPSPYGEADYLRGITIDAQGALGGGQRMIERVVAAVRSSGLTALSMTVGRTGDGSGQFRDSVAEIARVTQMCEDHADKLLLVRKASDLTEAKRSRRLGLICNFQDTSPFEGNLANVALFKGMGVRMVQLTYNRRNLAGSGAVEPTDEGLTAFGRQVIEEIEKQKILLDVSHGGRRTIAEALAHAQRPPTISHTGCRALADLPRNVDDTALRAVAEKGGVAGIYLMPFLRASGQPHAEDLMRHIEHAVKVCGEDHVGVGTDNSLTGSPTDAAAYAAQKQFYDSRASRGIAAPGEAPDVLNLVPEFNGPRRFYDIGAALHARGHSLVRIEKILGGNFARLFGEIWG